MVRAKFANEVQGNGTAEGVFEAGQLAQQVGCAGAQQGRLRDTQEEG
jgi:hypothetical protein